MTVLCGTAKGTKVTWRPNVCKTNEFQLDVAEELGSAPEPGAAGAVSAGNTQLTADFVEVASVSITSPAAGVHFISATSRVSVYSPGFALCGLKVANGVTLADQLFGSNATTLENFHGGIHLQAIVDVPAAGTITYSFQCGQVGGAGLIASPNIAAIYLPNHY